MADIRATQSSNKDDWETPWWLVKAIERNLTLKHGFDLDPAATSLTKKGHDYFDEEANGLRHDWYGNVFVNPPYSAISAWMKKGYDEAKKGNANVTMLVAARTDTRWWWDYARHGTVWFIKGRIKFVGATSGAPFPSAIVHFREYIRDPGVTFYWDIRQEEKIIR